MIDIKMLILETFFYEENTIFQVENRLTHKNVKLKRNKIKEMLNELILDGYLTYYDDPSQGQVIFMDSSNEFEEDYWFVLTEKGRRKLNL